MDYFQQLPARGNTLRPFTNGAWTPLESACAELLDLKTVRLLQEQGLSGTMMYICTMNVQKCYSVHNAFIILYVYPKKSKKSYRPWSPCASFLYSGCYNKQTASGQTTSGGVALVPFALIALSHAQRAWFPLWHLAASGYTGYTLLYPVFTHVIHILHHVTSFCTFYTTLQDLSNCRFSL